MNIFEDKKEDSGHFLLKSEVEKLFASCGNDNALAEYYRHIQHGKSGEILNLLEESSDKCAPYEVQEQLCHPLCTCSNCSSPQDLAKTSSISPMSRDSEGRTGLHIACIFGCPKVIKLLLTKGADISTEDHQGNTALHYAAMKGHKNCVLLLLHSGAELDHANACGNSPLHLAVENGHSGCVKGLLFYAELHGSMNCMPINRNGDTPLHLACKWGFKESVVTLLDQMKEGSYNIMLKNNAGLAPSDMCASQELCKLIIEFHKQYSCSSNSSPRFEGYFGKRPSLDSGCVSQSSPATTAVPTRTVNCAHASHSAQSLTVTSEVKSSSYSTMKKISQHELKKLDESIEAIRTGEIEKALQLLDVPMRKTSTVSEASLLCHPLCQCSQCSKTLSFDDCDKSPCSFMNTLGSDGLGVVHVATSLGFVDFLKHLLTSKWNPNLLSGIQSGCATALHLAAEAGNYDIAQLLLCHGADIDAIDINGNTALHLTAASGNGRLLDLLLKSGANTSAMNYEGQMPEDIAREFGYLAAVEMLLQSSNEST
ncbi:Ankyrin repeat [Trinorchestia longiramus]|nr:Ankyrin repeat [Trinorchestia longiramus]